MNQFIGNVLLIQLFNFLLFTPTNGSCEKFVKKFLIKIYFKFYGFSFLLELKI